MWLISKMRPWKLKIWRSRYWKVWNKAKRQKKRKVNQNHMWGGDILNLWAGIDCDYVLTCSSFFISYLVPCSTKEVSLPGRAIENSVLIFNHCKFSPCNLSISVTHPDDSAPEVFLFSTFPASRLCHSVKYTELANLQCYLDTNSSLSALFSAAACVQSSQLSNSFMIRVSTTLMLF